MSVLCGCMYSAKFRHISVVTSFLKFENQAEAAPGDAAEEGGPNPNDPNPEAMLEAEEAAGG